jgi:formate dehydrogenase major subunit
MKMLNIKINGVDCQTEAGKTILQACRDHGVAIPTLCHDERLKPFGSCLLCRSEVKGARGTMLACGTEVTEGMEITTESEAISAARKMNIELLLSQHHGDCVAPCSLTCPANIDVQGYIAHIANGQYEEALKLIKERNPLPAVCGRVCTRPCEDACRRNLVDERVGIDYLKRFVADLDLESKVPYLPEKKAPTGRKAAVIGAGPAGLTCAWYLAALGHEVT